MVKSVSKLMVWLLTSSFRVSEGGFWRLEGVLCRRRRVLRPAAVLSAVVIY
jgi:hypothetical protein